MATRRAVMTALKMFALTFAGDVSDERIDLYFAALDDVSDDALAAATLQLVRTHRGEWIPTPATIRDAAGANTLPVIDAGRLLREIDRLGEYSPGTGWESPSVDVVREKRGDLIADAYAAAGGPERLFEGGATTREIAAREFAQEMAAQVKAHGAAALLPPAAPAVPRLAAGAPVPEIEAPAAEPFDWRAALAASAPVQDFANLDMLAAAGDALAAKYLDRLTAVRALARAAAP